MVLRDAVPQDLVREARRLINRRIGQEGIEPDRIAYYQQNYWFPEYMQHPRILDLWHQSDLLRRRKRCVRQGANGGMIALRFHYTEEGSQDGELARAIPLEGHFDGLRAVTADGIDNGVELGVPTASPRWSAWRSRTRRRRTRATSGSEGRASPRPGLLPDAAPRKRAVRAGRCWIATQAGQQPNRFIPRYVTEQYAAAEGSEQTKDARSGRSHRC